MRVIMGWGDLLSEQDCGMACRDAAADGIAFCGVGQCLVRQQARVTRVVARVAFRSAKGGASGMRTFRGAKRDS